MQDYLQDYMECIPNFLPKDTCHGLIELFERASPIFTEFVDYEHAPKFEQLNLHSDRLKTYFLGDEQSMIDGVIKKVVDFSETNIRKSPIGNWLPEKFAYEEFRVKKYREDTDDQYGPHVDVNNLASAKRFMAFLIYLNDDFEGGETVFHFGRGEEIVRPSAGGLLLFPPTWMFPHSGKPVKKRPKYILSTYLNYI